MYTPRWFKEDRLPVLFDAIEGIAFGTLVTTTLKGLIASHIPMFVERSKGDQGTLYGHIARGNSQWRDSSPDIEALAMFVGPDAYITPNWYQTKEDTGKTVPTWNYVAIHVYGHPVFFDDKDRLLGLVTHLTNVHEAAFETPWKVSEAPHDYIEAELKSIVGFEMPISRIEGKWKMNQNRSDEDRSGVIKGLSELHNESADEVVAEMKRREEYRVK
jgi:transcriptional regulator